MWRHWWLTLVGLAVLAGAGRAAERSAAARAADWLASVGSRVEGRIRGSLVRPGMTQAQVDRVLPGGGRLDSAGLVGGTIFQTSLYSDYGLIVSFGTDRQGTLRVEAVRAWPLAP